MPNCPLCNGHLTPEQVAAMMAQLRPHGARKGPQRTVKHDPNRAGCRCMECRRKKGWIKARP